MLSRKQKENTGGGEVRAKYLTDFQYYASAFSRTSWANYKVRTWQQISLHTLGIVKTWHFCNFKYSQDGVRFGHHLRKPHLLTKRILDKSCLGLVQVGAENAQQPRLRHLVTSCFLEIFRYFNEKLSTILRNQLTPWLDNIMIHCNTRNINFLRRETKTLGKKCFLKMLMKKSWFVNFW